MAPEVMKFTILIDPSLLIITTKYSVYLICARQSRKRILMKLRIFTIWPMMPSPSTNNCAVRHEISNLRKPSLARHYHIFHAYQWWSGEYNLMHKTSHNNPCPISHASWKFTILTDLSYPINTIQYNYFVWSMFGSWDYFKRNSAFSVLDLFGHALA